MKHFLISLACLFVLPLNSYAAIDPPSMSLDTSGVAMTIVWTEVEGATGYNFYYAPYPYAGPETIGVIDVGKMNGGTFPLWEGAAFYVAVSAYNGTEESGVSNVEYFIMGPPAPEWVDDDGDGYTDLEGDCDDSDSTIYSGADEVCGDDIDQDCDGSDVECDPLDVDNDQDGFTENQGDCNDTQQHFNPDATDICGDGIDQDCDGEDLVCTPNAIDDDRDGFTEDEGDCNDNQASINPGAIEVCEDGIDQDCNGSDKVCPVSCQGEMINPISLSIGTPLNQTISALGSKYYVFEVSVAGEYTIALTNMTTDNDWKLGEYISNCQDDYSVGQSVIAASANINTTDDIKNIQLLPNTYLLVVDEWNNRASSYTLSVTR